MVAESIIGAGILGDLNYSERQQSWAIELGQWLASLVIAFSRDSLVGQDIASIRQQTTSAIDRILSTRNIPLTTSNLLTSNDNDGVRAAKVLLDRLQDIEGSAICALVLIGECTMGLRSIVEPLEKEGTVRAYLSDLDHRCSELGIALEAFGNILLQRSAEDLSATGVNRLLVKLSKPLSVLIMSSDPRDADRLRIAQERRELVESIRLTRFRRAFMVHDVPSCRVRDITRSLDEHNPNILHFSGHGSNSALYFENERGEAVAVNQIALARLLATQNDLQLVVLNACYSRDQAQAIADAVGYCIGMEGSILDDDAVDFSREFYAALGNGRTFDRAFERAKLVVALTATVEPHLLKRSP